MSTHPTSSEGSPLLRLPRELRDQIYDACLQGSCFRIDHVAFFTVLSYDGVKSAVRGWPRWLLTNKQLLHEGFEQFYRQATGIECEHRNAQTDLRKSKPRKGEGVTQSRQTFGRPTTFSGLHQLRAIDLNTIHMRYYTKYDSVARPPVTLYISSLHNIVPLRRWLEMHQGSIEALKLTFWRPAISLVAGQESDWEIEMSQLENMPQLDRVEFAIYDSGPNFSVIEDPATVGSAVLRIKRELRRIASALVADGDGNTVSREWTEFIAEREWTEVFGEPEWNSQRRVEEWHVEVKRCAKRL